MLLSDFQFRTAWLPIVLEFPRYYTLQRAADSRSAARTTIRLLHSLVRLAQAHARLMCRTSVTLQVGVNDLSCVVVYCALLKFWCVQDAVVAVMLVETSMHTSAMLGVESVLHAGFPEDPDGEYVTQELHVLEKLKLQ